jgi:hypothetical protein
MASHLQATTGSWRWPQRSATWRRSGHAGAPPAAGVGSNIEVVQAQDAVSIANEQYIAACGFALAKGRAGCASAVQMRSSSTLRRALMADQGTVERTSLLQNSGVRLGIAVVVLALAGVGLWLFLTAGRVSTDDAQVDAHVTQISARVGGTVTRVAVEDNQLVDAGTKSDRARSPRL